VLQYVAAKTDPRELWLQDLIAPRCNRAAVALANRNARVIQVLLSSGGACRPSGVAARRRTRTPIGQ
jgi:transposase